ncbi:MAG: hypothetical protein Q4B96_04635 [Bacillota bacterium]|nr:hypothetical protein [Bacillota bacterium]
MEVILDKLIPLCFLIIFGVCLRRGDYFEETAYARLQNFIVNVCIPCMMFSSFCDFALDLRYLAIVGCFFLLMGIYMAVGYAAYKLLHLSCDFFPFFVTAFGFGFMGLPLFVTVFGAENAGYITVLGMGHELFIAIVFLPLLQVVMAGKGFQPRQVGKSLASPLMIMVAAGLLSQFTGLTPLLQANVIGAGLLSAIDALGGLTLVLAMVLIGYRLNFSDTANLRVSAGYALARMAINLGVGALFKLLVLDRVSAGMEIAASPLFNHGFYLIIVQFSSLLLVMFVGNYRSRREQEIVNNATVITMLLAMALSIGYMALFV